jgi:hypothetical protein
MSIEDYLLPTRKFLYAIYEDRSGSLRGIAGLGSGLPCRQKKNGCDSIWAAYLADRNFDKNCGMSQLRDCHSRIDRAMEHAKSFSWASVLMSGECSRRGHLPGCMYEGTESPAHENTLESPI